MQFVSTTPVLAGWGLTVILVAFSGVAVAADASPNAHSVGVARVDITPDYPIRLSGFGFRRAESEGVTQRIWAKALAIDDGEPAVLVAVDTCGISGDLVRELAGRLEKKARLKPQRLAVTVTHTHTAPMLKGVLPTLFGQPIPKEHQERIDRYTGQLLDKLEKVALAALADRSPARLTWGVGRVGFANNRRTKGGPVDHDLPLLVVRDLKGKIRALYVSYACHCVTLSNNKISGDWAGYAQERIEDDHRGAIALVSVGCGADSNPSSGVTGDKVEIAARQGGEIAAEVKRMLKGFLAPVSGKLSATVQRFDLPLAPLPTRAEWEERARRNDARGYHAKVQLERLDRRQPLRTRIDYSVQTWAFGDSLALVFLPGEVVVDYSLRLKRELDGRRLWVNGYSNDVPCYIPSERVLKEGGYEGASAMTYYDVPAPFQPGVEQPIIDAVLMQIGKIFKSPIDPKRTGGALPQSPQQSLADLRTKDDLEVELMAAEPLVVDPVAIDWGPDGRLWVAEMNDYPSGPDGTFKPGGRIRVLEDTDGDGRYDRATVFLDRIPFPTDVAVWRKGVLVCAAPDILYAEDTDGDGTADVIRKLFSGFGTDNYQARVNSLHFGLDGWVHGSCGLFGGKIRSFAGGEPVPLGDRDFRCQPDTGILEPATGRTQQGRVRDDWGNWFGCDNSNLCRHYPLTDHYLRRNPHVIVPGSSVSVPGGTSPNRLHPLRPQLQLFKLSGPPGHTTAACGLGLYRDDLMGRGYTGNTFTCEPVNLLVHRLVLTPRNSTFTGQRADDEQDSEFLRSTDNWFRPVQARTGPDGCLWVVDMYRHVIEHPRWIPSEDIARLDLRAGSSLGRIYRVRPRGREPRPFPRLDRLDTGGLVAALDSPNGWQRDRAHQMLLWQATGRTDDPALTQPVALLRDMAAACTRPEARLHALCVLDGLGQLQPELVKQALADRHSGVRRHAIRLTEKFLASTPDLGERLLPLVKDTDAQVRLQLACTLGAWPDPRAGRALASLVLDHAGDSYLVTAALSSVHGKNLPEMVAGVFGNAPQASPPPAAAERLAGVATALGDRKTLQHVLQAVSLARDGKAASWQLAALGSFLDALERRGTRLEGLAEPEMREQLGQLLAQARRTAEDARAAESERLAALRLLGRDQARRVDDLAVLGRLLVPRNSPFVQSAGVAALGRIPDERVVAVLTGGWSSHAPALKSQILDLCLSRDVWSTPLLQRLESKEVPLADIDATRRQRLLAHRDEKVRKRAAHLLGGATNPDRQKVIDDYREVVNLTGEADRGKDVFRKSCAACHRLENVGTNVGPNLAALTNKSAPYLLIEVLDPNRNMDSRYVEYVALTRDGRTFTGLLASETATSVTLRGPEGKDQVLLRHELEELASRGKSLMPEGLEKDLSRQDLADLVAYLARGGPSPAPADPLTVARQLLDDSQPRDQRQALVKQHLDQAADLITALTADLRPGTTEEYRRIPWIWRVAVAAGKRNQAEQIRTILDRSLPKPNEPLRDWQAVVIGGGIINGISLQGVWPLPRLQEILRGNTDLTTRWEKALPQAASMADSEKTPTGTRYDALRMIALDAWERRGTQLARYLARGTHAELQMGAISGLADIDLPQVPPLLLANLEHFTQGNRKLALDALVRSDARARALLDALEKGQVKKEHLAAVHVQSLRSHKNPALRERALKLLPP